MGVFCQRGRLVRGLAAYSLAAGVAVATLVPAGVTPASLPLERAAALTFVVNSTGDEADAVGNGVCATAAGTCTLRAALSEANRNPGHDTVAFAIPGSGVARISPATVLPFLTDAAGVTIDGYTQPGSAPNTHAVVSNAQIRVELAGTGSFRGLFATSSYNVIRGLALFNFRQAIWFYGTGAHHNQVVGNFVGTSADATFAAPQMVTSATGVVMQAGAHDNVVGKPGAEYRNVISGNAHMGVATYDSPTTANVVQNNLIGLDPSGTRALANRSHGVDINGWTTHTLVGGTGPGQRNVVSGNRGVGVEISHGTGNQYNQVVANFIGTDPTGTAGPAYAANGSAGVFLEGVGDCVAENPPTGTCPPDIGFNSVTDNVIGNNARGGIMVHKGPHDSTVARNRIGVSANGAPIGNAGFGILIEAGAHNNDFGPGNEIANNAAGIQVQSIGTLPANPNSSPTNGNTITRNSIHDNGTNPGIDLAPLSQVNAPGAGDPNSNGGINAPSLASATPTTVSGTTCGGCRIEAFLADGAAGTYAPGQTYLASATADAGGRFSVSLPSSAQGKAVTATTTDAAGNTSEFARSILVPEGLSTLGADDFTRTVSDGWGSADIGGPYTVGTGTSGSFAVNGSVGTMHIPTAGASRFALVLGVSARDVDLSVRAGSDKASTWTYGQFIQLVARRVAHNTEYRARLRVAPNGSLYMSIAKALSGSEKYFTSEVAVPGVVFSPTSMYPMRLVASGANPTTLQFKVWLDGQLEPPGWQITAQDSEPSLQTSGSAGVRGFLSGSATAPITLRFDGLRFLG